MNAKEKVLSSILCVVLFYLLFTVLQAMFNYDVIPWTPLTDILTWVLFSPIILIVSVFSSIGLIRYLRG